MLASDQYPAFGPLPVRSQNPLYLLYIAQPLESTQTTTARHFQTSLETTFTNLFERHLRTTGLSVDMDMESSRTAIIQKYGLFKNHELTLEIPFFSTSGGFMDAFVQGYHNTFGLPNSGREFVRNGRYSFEVLSNGVSIYSPQQTPFRAGDITVGQKIRVYDESQFLPALAIRTSIKLPTGSPSYGTGSGKVDVSFSLLAEKSIRRFHLYSQVGFSVLGRQDELEDFQKRGTIYFSQAVEFNLVSWLSLVAQIDFVSPLLKNTNLPEVSEPALDLTIGFTGEAPIKNMFFDKVFYKAAFMEDPTGSGPATDFTAFFQTGIRY